MMRFATVSSIAVPRNTIRSTNRRDQMSCRVSPRWVISVTVGTQ
jgi:hypothetical protein